MTVSRSIGSRARAGGILVAATMLLAACGSSPTPSGSAPESASPSAIPTPTATARPTAQPTPIPPVVDEAMLHRRFTVLVAGEDQSAARAASGYQQTNTDALMVVSVNGNQSQIVMLSIPRDTVDVPLGDGRIDHGKINAISRVYDLETLQAAVSALLDVPIDAYLKIDMDDLVTLVDAVGGVDVDVPTHLHDAHIGLDLPAGPTHLDGARALAYSRSRADSDYRRAARQQQVVLALVRAFVDPETRWSPADLLASLSALETNLDWAMLPTFLAIARRASDAAVTASVLEPPRFALFVGIEPGTSRGWVMIPNVAEMRAYAGELIGD
jgi:polyisoprenyl-teichoic acid--peptidoglycan teichoic acid transferase